MNWTKKNFLHSLFINANSFARYLSLFIFLSLLLFIWFFGAFLKLKHYQHNLTAQIQALKQKEVLLNNLKTEIHQSHFDIQIAHDNFDKIVSNFEASSSADSLDILMQNAKESGLIVEVCNSTQSGDKNFYTKTAVLFCFTGSFEQVLNFFKLLSESNAWLKFQKLKFINSAGDKIKVEGVYKFYKPKKGFRWPR